MIDQSADGNAVWHVTRVEDTFGPVSFGGNNRIKRVWYHVIDGTDSYVDVPLGDFTAPKVAEAIEQAVIAHIDVMSLKGQHP